MIIEKTNYGFPTNIRFGAGVIKELAPHLKEQNLSKPLIVTDPVLATLPFLKQILSDLQAGGLDPVVFCEIAKNPVKSNVLKGDTAYKEASCDSIVGIGGGASMDVARSIALKINHDRDLFDYEDSKGGDRYVTNDVPYFVTVPTTSGTGSEVGRSSVISDDETHQKMILFSPKLLAPQVFADPELTLELPPMVTATTGMDALTHNVEAYLAKGFHPMCDGIALEGIRLVHESLVTAVKDPSNLEARSKMMIASLMGAVAFQKGLGVVHSTAHALSTHHDMHHGLANAIMIAPCMKFNESAVGDRLATLARMIELPNATAQGYIDRLQALNEEIGISNSLSSQGITEKDVDPLSKLALQDVCHQCNVKPVKESDFQNIYRSAL